jgi:hypothetical protein
MCNKGFSGYLSILPRSKFDVDGQGSSPQSLTAHSLNRYGALTIISEYNIENVILESMKRIIQRPFQILLFVYSRVGKNRDTRRESPAGAGAGRTADHLAVLFSQKVLAVRSANYIYRPVMGRYFQIQTSVCYKFSLSVDCLQF